MLYYSGITAKCQFNQEKKGSQKKLEIKKFLTLYKMDKEIIAFGDIEVKSNCFIAYKDDFEKIMPLCIMLSKMSANRRDFDETKYMPSLIKDNKLLEKYNKIWAKSAILLKKDLTASLYTMKNIKG